jgi:EpsI family protein
MSVPTDRVTTSAAPLWLGGTALGAGLALVATALARFWGANPDHADRFLILLAAGWAAWQARPALLALTPSPARAGYLPLLAGSAAFPVAWFLVAQVGPKPVVLWWLATAWVSAAAGAVLLVGGPGYLRRLAFPLGFLLFALPVPNRILGPLQFALQSATTTTAAAALPLLGVPVERHGFVLSLAGGDLGVAEACSGVRSVTALVAIAAFVAWHAGFGFLRGGTLVVLSVPLIAAVNAVRVIVSGLLHEYASPEYVRGNWHEALGIGMILLGLGCIVALARWLAPRSAGPVPEARPGTDSPPRLRLAGSWPVGVVLACGAGATAAAQLLGSGVEEEIVAAAPLQEIPLTLGRWTATDVPVPDDVAGMLTFDTALQRSYRDLGYEVNVWAVFWSSRNMVKGYHHPDVCWPNRGFRLVSREVVPVEAGGGRLPVTVREFARGHDRQLILYWTQEGRRVWSADDERRVQAAGDSHDWLEERLFRKKGAEPTGRLMVLLGTPVWGDDAAIRTQTLELTRRFAAELYRVCPWAAPPVAE